MPFSLLKCYDRVIERNYSPITLQSWLHEACGFRKKKKKWLYVERERRRERENTSIQLECILPDVLSRSSEMVEKVAVEEEIGGSQQAEGCSHIHHHLFVYIETSDHLETDSVSISGAQVPDQISMEQHQPGRF